MLLVEYVRKVGSAYLSQILTEPITKVLSNLCNCEMDIQKIKKNNPLMEEMQLSELVDSNRKTLENTCKIIFDHIFSNSVKIPLQIREMCAFLWNTMEAQTNVNKTERARLSSGNNNGYFLHSACSPLSLNIMDVNQEWSRINMEQYTENNISDISPEPIENTSVKAKYFAENEDNHNELGIIQKPIESNIEYTTLTLGQCLSPKSITDNQNNDNNVIDDKKNHMSVFKDSIIPHYLHIETSALESSLSMHIIDQNLPQLPNKENNEILVNSNLTNWTGNLSNADKVVGSFLFLRFIVPGNWLLKSAITSPDTNGIIENKISPEQRRGLVLCGKMLTALCNDHDFGHKEMSLIPCNDFLNNYRSVVKEFLTKASMSLVSNI